MIKIIRIAVLLTILFISVSAYPIETIFKCSDSKSLMRKNMSDGFAYLATATEAHGAVIQLYINLKNGRWRILGIDNKDRACNILSGIEFTFLKTVSM